MRRIVVVAVVVGLCGRAHAWNPVKTLVDAVESAGRAVGGVIGAPLGGFVNSLSAPTIHTAEDAGHRLITDANAAIGAQIDHAGSVTAGLVKAVDDAAGRKLDTIDHDLTARIAQVTTSLDTEIGRLDGVLEKRIAQLGTEVQSAIKSISDDANKILANADAILGKRIADLGQLASTSIAQADAAAKARIAQLDEVAGRRLDNLDAIATKQELGLESMLLRIAAVIAWLVFTAFVLWRLFRESADAYERDDAVPLGTPHTFRVGRFATRLAAQAALAAGFGLFLYRARGWLPHGADDRVAALVTTYRADFTQAQAARDLSTMKLDLSQLEVLVDDTRAEHAVLARAQLEHEIFARPGRLQSLAGVQELATRLDAQPASDPDILVMKAYVTWQVGGTRADEYEAATLCLQALAGQPSADLAELARHYIAMFLYDPYARAASAGPSDDALRAALGTAGGAMRGPLAHVGEYDALVTKLDAASTAAYIAMIEAQAQLVVALAKNEPAAQIKPLRNVRTAAAASVVAAWRAFDDALQASPTLAGDPTVLAAFTLDDAVLTHAKYYLARPDADDLSPLLMATGKTVKPIAAVLRAEIAPLRVAWGRRYAALLGARAADLVAYEEAQRFAVYEARDHAFEAAYVAYAEAKAAAKPSELAALAAAAAERAAEVGLYQVGAHGARIETAQGILDDAHGAGAAVSPDTLTTIAASYQVRRLRLL